jgi:hypothetical protein
LFSNIVIRATHEAGTNNGLSDVDIRGARNTISGLKMRSEGAVAMKAIYVNAAEDITLRDIEVDGYRNLVDLAANVTGFNIIDYSPSLQRRIVAGLVDIYAPSAAVPFIISRRSSTNTYAAGTSISPRPARETLTHINVTTADAFTISYPLVTPYVGMEQEIAVWNNTAGALGVVTWHATYTLRSTFVNPGAGDTVTVRFIWDGTNWQEISRSVTAFDATVPASLAAGTTAAATGSAAFAARRDHVHGLTTSSAPGAAAAILATAADGLLTLQMLNVGSATGAAAGEVKLSAGIFQEKVSTTVNNGAALTMTTAFVANPTYLYTAAVAWSVANGYDVLMIGLCNRRGTATTVQQVVGHASIAVTVNASSQLVFTNNSGSAAVIHATILQLY